MRGHQLQRRARPIGEDHPRPPGRARTSSESVPHKHRGAGLPRRRKPREWRRAWTTVAQRHAMLASSPTPTHSAPTSTPSSPIRRGSSSASRTHLDISRIGPAQAQRSRRSGTSSVGVSSESGGECGLLRRNIMIAGRDTPRGRCTSVRGTSGSSPHHTAELACASAEPIDRRRHPADIRQPSSPPLRPPSPEHRPTTASRLDVPQRV